MNKVIVIVTLILSLGLKSTNSYAVPVGAGFNYQGELIDGGSPANGIYDFQIRIYSDPIISTGFLSSKDIFGITVTDGLFSLNNVDFGDATYDGNEIWLELWVRPQNVGGLIKLDPRQRLHAVPYSVQADFLAPNGANNNDVLQFDGTNWVASAVSVNSPWTDNGTSVSYLGKVGVGVTNNAFSFQVKQSNANIDPIEVTDNTGVGMFRIKNNGNVGIRVINPQARLDIFSPTGTSPLKIKVGPETALKIDGNARAKIGTDAFDAKLAINEADGGQVLAVKRNGLLELLVESDGGVSIGSKSTGSAFPPNFAPDGGLYVAGDMKTSSGNNGFMKHMVSAFCGGSGTTIQRSYTAILNPGANPVSISNVSVGICDFSFTTTVNDRYLLASAQNGTSAAKTVNCSFLSANSIRCRRYDTTNSNASSGNISLFIY